MSLNSTAISASQFERSTAVDYAVALAAVAIAVLIRWLLDPVLNDKVPFATLYGGVALAVWFGGWRPAVLATIAGFLAVDHWFIPPRNAFGITDPAVWAGTVGYSLSCSVIIYLGEGMRRARRRAEIRGKQLEHEIRERAQAEEAVRAKETELRSITEVTPIMLTRCSRDLRYLYVNRAYAAMLGSTPEQIAGRPIEEVMGEEGFETIRLRIERVLRGECVEYEDEVSFEISGETRWLRVIYMPDADEHGQVNGWIASITDITTRKRAEEAARHSEQRVVSILNTISDGFQAIDANGRYTYVNPAITQMWATQGMTTNVIGKGVFEVFPEARETELGRAFLRSLNERVPLTVESLYPPYQRWYFNRYFPAPDGGVSIFTQDITDGKRAEQETLEAARQQTALYRLTDQLHRAESTANLHEAALDAIISALECDRASILLFDDTDVLRFVAWRGLSEEYRQATEGHSPWKRDAERPQPICVSNIATAGFEDALKSVIEKEGIAALAFIPLVSDGILIGKSMAYFNSPHDFSEKELELSVTIGQQFAFALERRRAEEALRESEERLRLATQTGKMGVWEWDIPNNHISWSDSLYPIHGVEKASFAATVEAFSELVHPEDRELVSQTIERTLKEDVAYELTFRALKPNGDVVWIFTDATVLRRDGKPVRMIGATTDITERKLAEEALRARTQELEALLDLLPVPVWIATDPGCLEIRGNRAASDLYAVTRNTNVSQSPGAKDAVFIEHLRDGTRVAPEDLPMQRAATKGEPQAEPELEVRLTTGERRVISGGAVPLRDSAGNIRGVIAALADVTERKQAEKALARRASEQAALYQFTDRLHRAETLADVYESALDAILSALRCDRASILLFDDAGVMRFVGSRGLSDSYREAVEGHSPWKPGEQNAQPICLNDVAAGDLEESLKAVIQSEGIDAMSFIPLIGNGKVIGKFMAYFNSVHFFTEEELDLSITIARQLGFGIERKRGDQEREQLLKSAQEARSEAEAANRIKDEFLATLSHELRTPLNAILGWSSMLSERKVDNDHIPRAIEAISRNARAQAKLIDDILDMSRIITGNIRLDARPVELPPVIDAAIDAIRPAADAKHIRVSRVVDRKASPVLGDAIRLQEVVWNLLSNAVKFTQAGGRVKVHVRAGESIVQVIVSDNGQGISHDFLPHVFDRFRQADGTLTRRHKGLGLGLAIVRNLVEIQGGTVEAKSEGPGKGATFIVSLPALTQSTDVADVKIDETVVAKAYASLALSGLRILVVDDEEDAREMIAMMLKQCEAIVETAASARDALLMLSRWQPDVLISDIQMPVTDGYAFIRQVRAREAKLGTHLPAIALTAHAKVEDRLRALEAGFQLHVAKPVDLTELAIAVASLADRITRQASPFVSEPG